MIPLKKDRLIKIAILTGFVIWIIYLLQSGSIDLYLSPNLIWLSNLAAVLLILLAAAILLSAEHGPANCCGHPHVHDSRPNHSHNNCSNHSHNYSYDYDYDHNHHHGHTHPELGLSKILIFCIPLLLGFAVKPQVLDSTALVNSINTVGSLPFFVTRPSLNGKLSEPPVHSEHPENSPTASAALESTQNISTNISTNQQPAPADSKITATDLVQLALADNPEQIYNHSYRLTGFVYKDPRLAKNQFVLTRFVITCCVVDAQPIGIITELPDDSQLKANTWLEVEGVLKKRAIKDSEQINPVANFQNAENTAPYLIVTKLKVIPVPKAPYLSPPQ